MKTRMLISGFFGEPEIEVADATDAKDQNAIAVHLLEPDQDEIDRAVEDAMAQGFELVVCHTKKTWPGVDKRAPF